MAQPSTSLTNFNLKLLQTFILVAEHRNFRQAAELTLRSQSAVSAQIKQLERQLGMALFHRTTRSVKLTPEGEQLLAGARRAADEVEHSLRLVREAAELRHGRVTLGCAPSIAASCLPKMLSLFERDYPEVKVFLREMASDGLLASLRDGKIDFAIAQAVPPEPDIKIEVLLNDPIMALVPRSIVPRKQKSIDLRHLAEMPLLQLAPVTSMRQLFDAEIKRQGLTSHCKYDCINTWTLIAMAEAGLGVAVLPHSVLKLARSETTYAMAIRPKRLLRQIALIYRSDRPLSPAAARLAQLARERIAEMI